MARQYVCNPDYPVVDTKAGKIRGYVLDGIFTFLGVDYARAKRFRMPEDVEPWEGTKTATGYGPICPVIGNPVPSGEQLVPHRFWPDNENCLNLNIWTTTLDRAAKRPVIVWYHGGGYSNGSAIEHVAYEADALCEYGDVVTITVNHRLNILGHLDMSSFGEQYKNSVNAGIADIVASLKWIRDNIEGFGGDPENVTVFGQSGGGGKVCTLLQVPEAEGLFHKVLMMSGGAGTRGGERPDHRPVILAMMEELGISENEPERLEKVPYDILIRAYARACRKLNTAIGWAPVKNEWYLGHPVEVGFTEYAKTVPTMVSSVFAEFSGSNKVCEPSDPEDVKVSALREKYGEDTDEIIDLFRKAYPDKDIARIPALDVSSRQGIIRFMEKRDEAAPSAPGYSYLFGTEFDVDGGTPAWHCADIPFMFYNTFRVGNANMEGVTEQLEDEMAGALVAFAYSGNPNHAGLLKWEPYTNERPATMVFDRNTELRIGYDKKLIELLAKHTPPRAFVMRIPDLDGEDRAWLY